MTRKTKWNGGENDIHRLWNVNLYAFSLFTSSSSFFYGKLNSNRSHGIASIYSTRCISTSDKMDHFYLTKYPDVSSIFSPSFLPIQKKWNESEKEKYYFDFNWSNTYLLMYSRLSRIHSLIRRFCQLGFVWFICVKAYTYTYTHKHATNTAIPINQVLSCATKVFVLICMAQLCWHFTLNWELRKWKFQTSSFPHTIPVQKGKKKIRRPTEREGGAEVKNKKEKHTAERISRCAKSARA